MKKFKGFNPLRIGSYCNKAAAAAAVEAAVEAVSIPLESGHIVICGYSYKCNNISYGFQSP